MTKPGEASVKEIIDFYGKENTTGTDKEGLIVVKRPYGAPSLTFYPETKEAEITKPTLERPAVKPRSREDGTFYRDHLEQCERSFCH